MRWFRGFSLHLCLVFLLACRSAAAVSDGDVDVLVVFPETPAPSQVFMMTDGEFTRGVMFGPIFRGIGIRKRSEELGAQLDETLQGYDRYSAIFQALATRFKQRSAAFALTESRQPAQYLVEKGITPAAAEQGYDYVVAIEDKFSGLSMLNAIATRTDDVAPMTILGYRVYETRKKAQISKGAVSANGLQKRPFRDAVKDREFFVSIYGTIADSLANQIIGTLFRTDQLHAMAASAGHGNDVPEVGAVLKKYENRFDYSFAVPRDWKRVRMNTKYRSVLEPKSDLRLTLGLRFDIDLLVPEFGQDVKGLDEYLTVWLTHLADSGLDAATFVEFKDITVPREYRAYILNLAGSGRQIILLRLLNEEMIEMVSVICLKDFDTIYPANRPVLEQAIANAKLRVH